MNLVGGELIVLGASVAVALVVSSDVGDADDT